MVTVQSLTSSKTAFEEILQKIRSVILLEPMSDEQRAYLQHEEEVMVEALNDLECYIKGDHPYERWTRGELKGDNRLFTFDWKGNTYRYFRIRPVASPEFTLGGMPCRSLCGRNWKRPHFTCLTKCYGNSVWYGKAPPIIKFGKQGFIYLADRPRWKVILGRAVASILEYFYA